MTSQHLFTDPVSQQIWDGYFTRLARVSGAPETESNSELYLEIQDHLYESFSRQSGDSEAGRLMTAIKKMGEPEDYLRPMMASNLLADASRSRNPRTIAKGLWYNMSRGLKGIGVTLLFFLGYAGSFAFLAMALGKPFIPDRIGFFVHESGMSLGIMDTLSSGSREILGWYIIPMGICLSLTIFLVLTRLLREINHGGPNSHQD